ncbi:hypothetical protein NDU88_007960 [Pleurodeles waltl]|uniref:Uncharacterized protein n=1 Tax=Pleurodeles waltl TaxID=8319 RepID=A0AAV7PMX4_PLEWA|nr:hypothetical protein NDU88_007960 [Pleurodeles waltl]
MLCSSGRDFSCRGGAVRLHRARAAPSLSRPSRSSTPQQGRAAAQIRGQANDRPTAGEGRTHGVPGNPGARPKQPDAAATTPFFTGTQR